MRVKNYDNRNWRPLEKLIGSICAEFMWMLRREVASVIVWLGEIHDQTCCSTDSSLGMRARPETAMSEATPTMYPNPTG